MRKSILACSVSFLMSPMAIWALGMGDIQVNSSLNQPLNAEIALHSVTKKDLDSLRVALAPRSIYSRADIERSEYLTQFKFKVIQRNGKSYVTITTKKAFREPFANFLIEVNWGSGRLLREYTMLLDPPEFIKKQTRPVTTASTSSSSQVKRTRTKSVAASQSRDTTAPPSYAYSTGTAATNPYNNAAELEYGPTRRNDTLWNIAKKLAPNNVSVDQMMMALLRDNPEAFISNNINNLKSGYVLRIKDRESLNKLSRSNANRQVKEQYQSWKQARQQKPTANIVDRSDRSQDKAPVDGQLKLVASGDSDNADMQGDLSSKAKKLKDKLTIAGEELESKEVENQELRARIQELEELLKTKSSLVELKDESLAALQKQKQMQAMAQQEIVAEAEPEISKAEEATEQAVQETTETIANEKTSDGTAETDTAATEGQATEQIQAKPVEPTPVETTPVETRPVETAVAKVPVKEITPVAKPKPKPKPKPVVAEPEEEIIDILLSEEMLPYTAGGAGFLVLLLGWLGLRGRGKKENEFEESILDSKMEVDDSEFAVDDSELTEPATTTTTTEALASDTETSFLSDFSADDMESLQPDDTEADPMSEADVFMVYGRYQQAEELLQSAIKSEPERLDYQLKLLEVYHGDNLKDSFAVQADVVKELLKKNNDDYELTSEWTKAKSWAEKLGLNIDMPDSFDEESTSSMSEEISSLDDSLDLTLDDDQALDELSLESEEISFNEDSILGDVSDSDDDFDLSLDESLDSSLNVNDELSLEDIEDTTSEFSLEDSALDTDEAIDNDFELSLDDFDEQINADELSLEETTQELDENSLELNEDSLELDENSLELNEDSLELDENSLELNEDSLKLDENSLELNEDSLELDENSLELDENSLELNEDSLELDENSLELDENSLELNENSLELDENSLELNEDSLELDENSLELNEDSLELDENSLELEENSLELNEDNESEASISPELEVGDLDEQDELELLGDDLEFDELDDDFPELDAVGTKLDLAKAYIDMGDMESASSILNEVIDEGDEEQKAQAQSLLNQTDS